MFDSLYLFLISDIGPYTPLESNVHFLVHNLFDKIIFAVTRQVTLPNFPDKTYCQSVCCLFIVTA
jgi:hypothetical protein